MNIVAFLSALFSCGVFFMTLYIVAYTYELTWLTEYFVVHVLSLIVYWTVYLSLEKRAKKKKLEV